VILADRRCSGVAGIRGSVPMIRREVINPVEAFWAQAPASPLADRVREMLPGVSSSLLNEFANARGAIVLNDETARVLGATAIATSEVAELFERYEDPFAAWDALFRTFPTASALVELSPVSFNESETEALVYCGHTVSPIGGQGSVVFLRRTETATWIAVAWRQVWIS